MGKWFGFFGGLVFLICLMCFSLLVGTRDIPVEMVLDTFRDYHGTVNQLIILTDRLPRTLIAVMVGASLAVAGAITQVIFRNPLASETTLGINGGASFMMVLSLSLFTNWTLSELIWVSFIGSGLTFLFVFSIGRGHSPLQLTLAGTSIAALFSSMTQGFLVLNERSLEQMLYWLTGSVEGRKLSDISPVLPYMLIGVVLAFFLARSLNLMALSEEVSKSLGLPVTIYKLLAGLVVVLLAGSSVAIAGPISFVGLLVPHLAKMWVGQDHRLIIPFAALFGAVLLLVADIISRAIMIDQVIPVGVMTAVIGAPIFLYLVRKSWGQSL
ncbi:FecCD family ABC transporter permease [Shimazuella alba]|uniref:Iron chelate uptake ABC transporter family permease subunit n=1 Tax=Shimazuella alba TaxID=2690964 RepID=A0A6I4VYC9_9BACL|nr:iron ABC transporter permease [Shimazuella alba]MXQ55508.1 iron chelate uptake ABC transporter family permease subunit [Shimazuella alba]